ncbi:unnamed protein product [Rhodiola kirilowii]
MVACSGISGASVDFLEFRVLKIDRSLSVFETIHVVDAHK